MVTIQERIAQIESQLKSLSEAALADSIRTSTAKRFVPAGDAYYAAQKQIPLLQEELSNLRIKLSSQIINLEPVNIAQNTKNQLGDSIEPVITQINKPENQGLILFAGLVAAALILK